MTESSDTSDTPAKPQDYAGLRAELAALADDFTPVITELWPRLEDHKYRWELHSYGLAEGYDKLVVSDIIALLIEALKGIGVADNNLLGAHIKAKHTNAEGRVAGCFAHQLVGTAIRSPQLVHRAGERATTHPHVAISNRPSRYAHS
jgi:hypothetical protein